MKVRKVHHVIIFGEGSERYSMIDPNSEALGEAAHTARYDLARLTQTQAYLLCEAFESYQYIASACPTTGLAIDMLRRLRNAREVPAHAPDAKAKEAEPCCGECEKGFPCECSDSLGGAPEAKCPRCRGEGHIYFPCENSPNMYGAPCPECEKEGGNG